MATNDQQTNTNAQPAEVANPTTSSTASSQESLHSRPAEFTLPFQSPNAAPKTLRLELPVDYPYVESPANILIPLHFTCPRIEDNFREPGHPWSDGFQKIQMQLIKICDNLHIWCLPVYGRLHLGRTARGPRVLAFMMLQKSIARWKEVEVATKSLLEETFHGDGPPVRFYLENNPVVAF